MSKFRKISVITPVFNRENLIEETVESVLNQNYPNLEYIVINDGSTDKSLDKLKRYKNRIRLVNQKNQGEGESVNRGLRLAGGDIIGVVNSDDPLLPHSLFIIAKFFEDNPKIIAAYPDWQLIDEGGHKLNEVSVHEHDYRYMFISQHCYVGPGAFFTKKALELTGGRSAKFRYVSDFEFWLRMGLYGQLKRIPLTLATFRIHAGSQSQYAKGDVMAKENISLVRHIADLPNFPKHLKKELPKAYSSAYFLAAGKSLSCKNKSHYYFKSFAADPFTFSKKVKYELVKAKHKFLV